MPDKNTSPYSLQLFKLLIEREPELIPAEVTASAQTVYESLVEREASPVEVEQAMAGLGAQAWPYWEADETFYEKYGKDKEREQFLSALPEVLVKRWKEYEASGGNTDDFERGKAFEISFTPEENHVIQEAMVNARIRINDALREEQQGKKAAEYQDLVDQYKQEQNDIVAKMGELRELKGQSQQWDAEIDEFVDFIMRGFAELSERPTSEKVQGQIDYYRGQMEAGEKQ